MSKSAAPVVRCAVYTRKSSEEGLEQAFNSLDAQREAGLDYIKSQKHSGWTAISTHYDDGGYSGGSTDRPGLQRLLADIEQRRIDVVVVYKVDRLSRSLADFARLMQVFDAHHVSFVSVTQQFNTTTSMGRLTLNMLLSFAQFEREVAGERVRDKIAATKKKGVWISGRPPLGYRLSCPGDPDYTHGDRVLRIVESEAKLIRAIFDGYLELHSPIKLAQRLNTQGYTTKRHESRERDMKDGRPLTMGVVYRILTNPVYVGMITHTRCSRIRRANDNVGHTDVYPGLHQPIVSRATWDRVHEKMAVAANTTRYRWTHTHLLKGKIRTFEDHAMSPGSVQRPMPKRNAASGVGTANAKRIVRYYTSQKALKQGYTTCPIKSLNAGYIDNLVRGLVLDHLHAHHQLDLRGQEPPTRDHWIRELIRRVVVAPSLLTIELYCDRVTACAEAITSDESQKKKNDEPSSLATVPSCPFAPDVEVRGELLVLTLRIQIKRHDGKRLLLSPDGHDLLATLSPNGRPVPRAHLVNALGQAFAWRNTLMQTGQTVKELAPTVGVERTRINELLRLTQLSPRILKALLTGALDTRISLDELIAAADRLDWQVQAVHLGLVSNPEE